jgi:hypothetical protein
MITMARIQGLSLGHPGWQRPIFPQVLGQNGTPAPAPAPAPALAPAPAPSVDVIGPSFPVFPAPIYPPVYNYPVITEPEYKPPQEVSPAVLIIGGLAAGVFLTLLLS